MFELMADTNLKWHSQSVLSVEYLCVQGTLQQEEDRYSLSKPAVSRPYWCPCHHQLTDWLLDERPPDWCDRQLAWCPNLLPSPTPYPFHTAELSSYAECEWRCVFSLQQPQRLTSKLLGLAFIQQPSWYHWSIDTIGLVMKGRVAPKDILLMDSSGNIVLRE